MIEPIKDAVAAVKESAEFVDYLEGRISFNELMELLLEGLDEVDE